MASVHEAMSSEIKVVVFKSTIKMLPVLNTTTNRESKNTQQNSFS